MAIRKISTRAQLATGMNQLGRMIQKWFDRDARLKARVARAKSRFDNARAELARHNEADAKVIDQLATKIYAYVLPNWDVLSDGTPTIHTEGGTISRRILEQGAISFAVDEEAAVREIKRLYPELADQIIKTTEAVRKDVLKKDFPEVLAALKMTHAGSASFITIQPENTNQKYSERGSVLRDRAITLGLLT